MAKPIEPTPPLEGADAKRLLEDLEKGCTAEEWSRRVRSAKADIADVLAGKPIVIDLKRPRVISFPQPTEE